MGAQQALSPATTDQTRAHRPASSVFCPDKSRQIRSAPGEVNLAQAGSEVLAGTDAGVLKFPGPLAIGPTPVGFAADGAIVTACDERLIAAVGLNTSASNSHLPVTQLGVPQAQLRLLCGYPRRSPSSVSLGRRSQIRVGRA